jgi:AcrR family transcriptional regulator
MAAVSAERPSGRGLATARGGAGTLRERKRERTRRTIVDAGFDLFEARGYDETTIADIAEAAEIGARTFFSYFASKEELLFPEKDSRVAAAVEAIATRRPGERPTDVLLRALRGVEAAASTGSDGMVGRESTIRMNLIRTVPAVRGRSLQNQLEAQREIAAHLHAAFPDELDAVAAGALVGAFIGAVGGALDALLGDAPGAVDQADAARAFRSAVDVALRPWTER